MKCRVIYEDQAILVIYKPSGLATQTGQVGQADVVSGLKNYLAGTTGNKSHYLGIIHRLDQPVEGLLVFAKTREAGGKLSAQLTSGTLHKQYEAVVCGKPFPDQARLVDKMYKDAGGVARILPEGSKDPQAKRASLTYETIKTKEFAGAGSASLVRIRLETGRFHQIRAQLSHAGFPLLGDLKYGSEASLEMSRRLGVKRVALCACELALRHPATGKEMSWRVSAEGEIFQKFQME